MLTQKDIAKHLDMSERNARDVLKSLGVNDWNSVGLDEIRVAYIRDLREKAAGRGGNDQVNLSRQRAEESAVKTAMMRLEYHEKVGTLVCAEDASDALADWSSTANREYRSGINELIGEIQSRFKIEIPAELVDNIVSPATERIQAHAVNIGRDIVASSGDVYTAAIGTDGEVD